MEVTEEKDPPARLGKLRYKRCLAPNPPSKQKQCDRGVLAQAPIVTHPPP